jgi:hypothetical protein
MTATRLFLLASLRFVIAAPSFVCVIMTVGIAGEPGDRTTPQTTGDPSPTPRRSHIQPVGEVAVVSRNADTLGLRLTRATEVLRQQLALARGAGLVVEEVTPGSVADKAGFRQHDVLVLLDDQMLLLPEQLAALLEASNSATPAACTLLRGGAKVTIPIGPQAGAGQPRLPTPSRPVGPPTLAVETVPTRPSLPSQRQTAAKPSTSSRLRAPASALALLQPSLPARSTLGPATPIEAGNPLGATTQKSSGPITPTSATGSAPGAAQAEDTLLRQDPDYQIKLSRGDETRLLVLDPHGRIIFNDTIDSPEQRGLVPEAVRQRVAEMERSLEPASKAPAAAEIGRLDAAPIDIR